MQVRFCGVDLEKVGAMKKVVTKYKILTDPLYRKMEVTYYPIHLLVH